MKGGPQQFTLLKFLYGPCINDPFTWWSSCSVFLILLLLNRIPCVRFQLSTRVNYSSYNYLKSQTPNESLVLSELWWLMGSTTKISFVIWQEFLKFQHLSVFLREYVNPNTVRKTFSLRGRGDTKTWICRTCKPRGVKTRVSTVFYNVIDNVTYLSLFPLPSHEREDMVT